MTVCLVGLGYVGLPIAVAFSKKSRVLGFDVSVKKIAELQKGVDSSGEVSSADLKSADIEYSADPAIIANADFIIVAVPTPITKARKPDLSYLESASEIVGRNMKKGSVVVYESTVYPGATEEVCVPILEKESGLKVMQEFKVGYSPERINPGDKEHTVDKIIKVVSGCDDETLELVARTYGEIITAGIKKASSIKVAEASKVIENIQRDLNISLMNELSIIFEKIGIPTKEVIDVAGTKWNFHKYYPGLVGGHCIGVDPYYLTFKAQQLGYEPQVILAGRETNEYMVEHVAKLVDKHSNAKKILILGLTFKENVPDYRNSKAFDLIKVLEKSGKEVMAYDPLLKGKSNISNLDVKADCIILVSGHKEFRDLTPKKLKKISDVVIDIRSFFDRKTLESKGIKYVSL